MSAETLAILVGGGPAPGINGVIASATIEAVNSGLRVLGIYDGYHHLASGDTSHVTELRIEDVSRIHTTGGSILRTSRTNPAKDDATLRKCVDALRALRVRYLIAIGGDDTTYSATRIAESTKGAIGVATVPKTIDNDLPLPDNAPAFGFETARSVGTGIIESLMEDARTTERWYLVVSMGRKSGALALGMCKAAGATLAVIPEEFSVAELELDAVVDTIIGAIIKRLANDHGHGVAIVAEGIAERLSADKLAALENVARDAYGHVRLAEVPIGSLLRDAVRRRLEEIGVTTTIVAKDIGYELRCAKPVPFDVEYTRTLGYGAVRYLLNGGSGALIALSGGRVVPVQLVDLQDPQTGRVRIRMVDVTTESYEVARNYMIRLEPSDLTEPQLSRLASKTNLDPQAFRRRFATVARALALVAALLGLPLGAHGASSLPIVPPGFSIARIATVDEARELAFSPNGDLFVGTSSSDVYIVPHADGSGTASTPRAFAHFEDSPAAGVAYSGNSLSVGTQFAVWRVSYRPGDLQARSSPQKLASVRTSGEARDHVTSSVAVAKDQLYASVGSSCDACRPDLDETRATVGAIAGGRYRIVARHIRNAIALAANPNTGALWAGVAGQDYLPSGHPYEIFDDVLAHSLPIDYGWPYCYENHRGHDCNGVAVSRVVLPAYSTPIGAVFYPQHVRGRYAFPARYAGGAFVTLHGSWHRDAGRVFIAAPRVVFIPMHGDSPTTAVDWNDPNKQWSEFVGGYQAGGTTERIGRPTGIAVGPQGDLFVADDLTGAIYRIRPK